MELIEETNNNTVVKFSRLDFAILGSILNVFEHKMEQGQIDYEMLMHSEEEAQRFLDAFFVTYER